MLSKRDAVKRAVVAGAKVLAVSLPAGMVGFASGPAAATGPFSELGGTWRGDGAVVYNDGTRESLHCRSDYDVAANGHSLRQSMRCATAAYSFRVRADLSHSGGALQGHWSESAYNMSGNVAGRASGDSIQADVQGANFTARIAVTTRGELQEYTIRSQGTSVSEVAIRLRRQTG